MEGSNFKRLTKQEQSAVASYVKWDFDKLILLQPGTTVSMNALSDPEGWQDRLREVIAGDRRRLAAIMRASSDATDVNHKGFTLIELSIVLIIIGLIVGGVLTGRDLIKSAEVRATITQVEKFNQAVNTFYGKYGALPGDLNQQVASTFGFAPRGQYLGEGDGNGYLQGNSENGPGDNWGWVDSAGETVMFWSDLTYANGLNVNLIEGSFNTASPTISPAAGTIVGTVLNNFFPQAKLGNGNYFYVYSNTNTTLTGTGGNEVNYYGLSALSGVTNNGGCQNCIDSVPGLTVKQAYDIDLKLDDGLPTTGNVKAQYINSFVESSPYASSPSSTTCYDTTSGNYSITISGGANVNCALSFKMQAGD